MTSPLVDVRHVTKCFQRGKQTVTAVNDVSFAIHSGKTLGLVGESGCGKSTLGRCLLNLEPLTSGEIWYDGKRSAHFSAEELFHFRKRAQIIFQDPYSSLNPRMSALEIIAEPLYIHAQGNRAEILERVCHLAALVGLNPSSLKRFPHEFSGGQRQRIGIARALALNPQFLVCDEPISSLDVSVQAQIVNLLKDLQAQFNLTYFFIAHNLAIVKYLSDRVAVMYLGHLVELADADALHRSPLHPYTQALLAAIPHIPPLQTLPAPEPLLLAAPKQGCPFASRCPHAHKRCFEERPVLREVGREHFVACHLIE